MRQSGYLLIGLVLCSASLSAANLTIESTEKAQEVIANAVEAYGGADALSDMKSIEVASSTSTFATNQSLRPGPPWDENKFSSINAIDYETQTFANLSQGSGGGFEFNNGVVVSADNGHQLDFRAGTLTEQAQPDFDVTSGPFIRVSPLLLVKALSERPSASHYLGEAPVEGRAHDVINLVMNAGPALTLYFDQETHLLSRSERNLPGFGLVAYRFSGYEKSDGLVYHKRFELFVNDESNMDRTIESVSFNHSLEKMMSAGKSLRVTEAQAPAPMATNKVYDGVYHVGGNGTYSMFVDAGDYLIAVGTTGGADARIRQLRETFPNKPIRYAVVTHHHNDHLAGVPAYVAEGATLVTTGEHLDVVRAAAGEDSNANIETVDKRRTFKAGDQTLQLDVIGPTAHTNKLVLAWLPKSGIAFEADHFALPTSGEIPPAVSSTRSFAKALKKKRIKAKKFLSAHSPRVATAEELKKAIAKKGATTAP